MSWELASLIVLGAGLAIGFGWYERAHPSSRMLALVATLAALAAIARIAFAPLPNVKPTTDIIVIAGAALGGAPGFVVGAVAALASNLVFGQGPWTPWQMIGWGVCGLIGAALGRTAGPGLGRVRLAVACGLAGLVFGAIMDASVWATYGGRQTLEQYLAIGATSLPFNLAHVTGNVVFALAFGPLLLRALRRYRARIDVRWEDAPATAGAVDGRVVAGLLAALALAAPLLAAPPAPAASATGAAARYLQRAQNGDGGWGLSARARSAQLPTAWAVIGLGAARYDALRVRRRGNGPGGWLRSAAINSRATGDLERTALALAAAGLNPRTWDLDRRLRRAQDRDGSFDGLVNLTSYGVLALRAARLSPRDRAIRRAAAWLVRRRNRDGGFGSAPRTASTIDDTAGAVQALAAAGGRRWGATRMALRFLLRRQNPDGGFPLQPRGRSNAQSTALAVQALIAGGRRPDRRRRAARSPLGFLRSLQQRNGSIRYSRTSAQTPVWVTGQALAALARRPLPVAVRRR